jgi:hypothetical protein
VNVEILNERTDGETKIRFLRIRHKKLIIDAVEVVDHNTKKMWPLVFGGGVWKVEIYKDDPFEKYFYPAKAFSVELYYDFYYPRKALLTYIGYSSCTVFMIFRDGIVFINPEKKVYAVDIDEKTIQKVVE